MNPNKRTGSKIQFFLGVCGRYVYVAAVDFSPQTFPFWSRVVIIWKAVVIDVTSIVYYTEHALVDILPFEEKTWSLCWLRLGLSQIQCFSPPFFDGVLSLYFLFTKTCFVQLNNSTITELRTCRSCHLSYHLYTVFINAVFLLLSFPLIYSYEYLRIRVSPYLHRGQKPMKGVETWR